MTRVAALNQPRVRKAGTALGFVLLLIGIFGGVISQLFGPVPAWERTVFIDLEAIGSVLGLFSLLILPHLGLYRSSTIASSNPPYTEEELPKVTTVYVTRDLVEVLLELASKAEPIKLSAGIAVTRAGQFEEEVDLPSSVPVFTHFILPGTAKSASNVFGIDLGTPPGQTQGLFVSHPSCELSISKRDPLHEIVLVAIPPWDLDSVAVFDRSGRRMPMEIVDATPPEDSLPTLG